MVKAVATEDKASDLKGMLKIAPAQFKKDNSPRPI
jgi:hypothetical protein